MHAECGTGFFQKACHSPRKRVRDHRAFALPAADKLAEVFRLVVESAMRERLVENHFATVDVMDGCTGWVPPVGVNSYAATRRGEQGIAQAEQIETGVQLRHAALVLGL